MYKEREVIYGITIADWKGKWDLSCWASEQADHDCVRSHFLCGSNHYS